MKHNEKNSHHTRKIILFLLATFMLVGGVLIGWQTGFFSLENETVQLFDADVPLTDTTGLEYYSAEEDTIKVDDITGSTFINNQILVTLNSVEDRVLLETFIDTIGGEIVGEITLLADYQILLNQSYSLAELEEFVTILNAEDWVYYASTQYVIAMDTSYIPNDEFWQDAWDDDFPVGINWGLEAINATEAWDYQDKMQTTVNIGILDTMFSEHDDLKYTEVPLGMSKVEQMLVEKTLEWNDHGTHVAGIACAGFDNEVGLTGVSTNNNLYGASANGIANYGYQDMQMYKMALTYLILNKNCSVINISLGADALQFNASRGCSSALNTIANYSEDLEQFLKLVIEHGYDNFLICNSAGNQNDTNGYYFYFKKDEQDTFPYEYYSYLDYINYLNGEKCNYDYSKESYQYTIEDIEEKVLFTGNVDAKYDFMGAIDDELVSEHIIIVGAVENLIEIPMTAGTEQSIIHEGFQETVFSSGGERLDILAPGYEIYSTIQGGYDTMTGTSMATPYVTGVAGLVFSINPDLTGAQVKAILCESASTENLITDENCGMLDAAAAVQLTLTTLIDDSNIVQGDELDADIFDVDALVEFLMTLPSKIALEFYLGISGMEVEAALGDPVVRYEIKKEEDYQIDPNYANTDYVDIDALANDKLYAIVYITYDTSDMVSQYTVYYKEGNQILENRLNKGITVIQELTESVLGESSDLIDENRALYQAFVLAYPDEETIVRQYQFADLDQDGIEEMLLTIEYNDGILIGDYYNVYMLVDETVVEVCHGQSFMGSSQHDIYKFVTYDNKICLLKNYIHNAYDNIDETYYLINYQSGNIDDFKEYTSDSFFTIYEENVFYP